MLQAPLLALHLPKIHTEAIMCIPQIVTYTVREKGMESKEGQRWAFGRIVMQPIELGKEAHLRTKRHWTVKKSSL